jgi:hypothetical protein
MYQQIQQQQRYLEQAGRPEGSKLPPAQPHHGASGLLMCVIALPTVGSCLFCETTPYQSH